MTRPCSTDARQLLTCLQRRPSLRPAVAPVTQSLGGVAGRRQHWSGVVRRGAVDTTPVISSTPPHHHTAEPHPGNDA